MVCELDFNKCYKKSIVLLYTSSEHNISEIKKILFRKHQEEYNASVS